MSALRQMGRSGRAATFFSSAVFTRYVRRTSVCAPLLRSKQYSSVAYGDYPAIDPICSLWIGGKLLSSSSNETFSNINPATNEELYGSSRNLQTSACVICVTSDDRTVNQASKRDVDDAVRAAKEAGVTWSRLKGAERGRILNKAAQILRERNDELAKLEVLDNGKPIQEAISVDVVSAAESLEFFAGVAATLHGHHYDLGSSFALTRREALGVCEGAFQKLGADVAFLHDQRPALACGNTVVYKPSEMTPLSAMKLAEIFKEAGVPDGVFNVVQGDGRVGQMLTEHPDIRKISLTGSAATGKRIMAGAAPTLKYVTLELGGKSPLIIFNDADIEDAVSACLLANFYTQGEICSNGTRVYAQAAIHDELLRRLEERSRRLKIGDPRDPATQIGSLISRAHMEKVLNYVRIGIEEGAKLVCGGRRAVGSPALDRGNFVEPTIFEGCRDDMRICREEIFGPVMSVLKFEDEEEVTRRANDTEYGLGAGIFTNDLRRAHRLSANLQAGTVWINHYNISPVEVPFGGYKSSGIGRELSTYCIDHYTQIKSVYVNMDRVESPL